MEFYKILTKLLTRANELKSLNNLKKINQIEKQKYMEKFIETLKSFIKTKIETSEGRNFKIYFLEYLKDIINDSLSFCTEKEKNEILKGISTPAESLNIDDSNNSNKTNNNENNLMNNDINNKNNNKVFTNNNIDMNNDSNNNNEHKKIVLNLNGGEKGFYPKNYLNKNINNNNIPKFNPNNSNEDNSLNSYINENNQNYSKSNNSDSINEDAPLNIKENNLLIYNNNNNNNSLENNKNDGNNFISNLNFNYNINNNKNNESSNEYEKKENFNINDNIVNQNNKIKEISDNDETSESSHPSNKNYKNIKNNNINSYEYKKKYDKNNKSYKGKKYNNNSQKGSNNKKIANPADKFQKEIDYYYQYLYQNNIIEFFIRAVSDKKNHDLNQLCTKVFKLVENNKIEYIEQLYKEELTTLICVLFPFAKGQKSIINDNFFKSDLQIDKNLFLYLQKNILIIDNTKSIDFTSNKIENFEKNFLKGLFLESTIEGKNLIISAYIFLVISRCLRKYSKGESKEFLDDLLKREFMISFKIHFILEHQEYYNAISDDFIEVYNGLHFINVFYNEIFSENNEKKRIMKDDEINKYVFGKDNFVLSIDKNCNFDIDILFSEEDNKIYKETLKIIEYFYNIEKYNSNDINDLIYYSSNKIANKESNFILNIVEHICEKREYIYKDINHYKNVLKKIERKIFDLGRNILYYDKPKIDHYTINEEQKQVFYSLYNYIRNNINPYYKQKFNLYPYGSITQFLGGKNSDIDIYLDIRQIKDKKEKISFLYSLRDTIYKLIKKYPRIIISTRLCVIKFNYSEYDEKKTDFDISLMGFCPFIHSTLLRAYSLIDPRFSLLAITLKKFIEIIKIKSSENKIEFLNSFSWMVLLIAFLQDIIKPQVLPKLLCHKKNNNIFYTIEYGHNYEKIKCFDYFVGNIKEENTLLPESLFNSKSYIEIYEEQIGKKGPQNKNNLSCSELFLYFLEFIIYYFKSDSVYVNCSIENEGYESMYNILNYNDNNDINQTDERFSSYFKNKYCKSKNFNDNKKTRDGLILIRDPLDPHYNPGQTLKTGNYNTFIENLKKGYLSLLKNGDFDRIFINN